MRNPDPKYIVNLINQIVGKGVLAHIEANRTLYPNVWRVYETVGLKIGPHLHSMSPETLARIIVYSDLRVSIGSPSIIRRENMEHLKAEDFALSTAQFHAKNLFNGFSGRLLLENAALFTILAIIMDMIHQEEYEGRQVDKWVRSQEAEMLELRRRHATTH